MFWAQDDLAEHTMHSPVLRDNDPSDDLVEYWSDWEYYSDDYYDEVPARNKQNIISSGGESRRTGEKRKSIAHNGGRRKRRRRDSPGDIRDMSFDDRASCEADVTRPITPIVVWRSKEDAKNEAVTHHGHGDRVALLKDWRELFGAHSNECEIGRTTKFKKGDIDQNMELQSGLVDKYRSIPASVPPVTRPKVNHRGRKDLPDANDVALQRDYFRPLGHLTPNSKDELKAP